MSAEDRCFVDTNILVYCHDVSAGRKQDLARALIEGLWNSGQGCLSMQVLQEFYVTVTRKVPKPLDWAVASRIISDLGAWTIHEPAVEDVLHAIEVGHQHGISFWDAMIVSSASRLRCRVLWSEDLKDGEEYDGVKVRNPFAEL